MDTRSHLCDVTEQSISFISWRMYSVSCIRNSRVLSFLMYAVRFYETCQICHENVKFSSLWTFHVNIFPALETHFIQLGTQILYKNIPFNMFKNIYHPSCYDDVIVLWSLTNGRACHCLSMTYQLFVSVSTKVQRFSKWLSGF